MYSNVRVVATAAFVRIAASILTSSTPVCFIISALGSGLQRHQVGYITSHVTLADRTIVFGWGLGGCGGSGRIRKMRPVGPGFKQSTRSAIASDHGPGATSVATEGITSRFKVERAPHMVLHPSHPTAQQCMHWAHLMVHGPCTGVR
jgi:hypothetical protein